MNYFSSLAECTLEKYFFLKIKKLNLNSNKSIFLKNIDLINWFRVCVQEEAGNMRYTKYSAMPYNKDDFRFLL